MAEKWECIGFEFPQEDEEYPDSVVKVIMDMRVSPIRISKVEADTISAAPELLEACEMALPLIRSEPYCEDSPESECTLCDTRKRVEDCLRAAIAKARGEG